MDQATQDIIDEVTQRVEGKLGKNSSAQEALRQTISTIFDERSPGLRYLALRDLAGLMEDDPILLEARQRAHLYGPIAEILEKMSPEGYWVEPGSGYYPKYTGSVWSIILLAQLGGSVDGDERINKACTYYLDHAFSPDGQIGVQGAPSSTADCLQGNMLWSLLSLGFRDPRLEKSFDWMARTVTGEGLMPKSERHERMRYFAGKCGPLFACGSNNTLPCAWGGVKVLLAFGLLPTGWITPVVQNAIDQGVGFFLSIDPLTAGYPSGYSNKPSGNWWKFGFPVFYVTDLIQLVEALVELGYGQDPRLENALQFIQQKRTAQETWLLEYEYTGKTWIDFGEKKLSNPWVTLRALRVLLRT